MTHVFISAVYGVKMRSSEEERIFQLLFLLYDVCKDTLLSFFASTYLKNDLTDENISQYISKNKDKLLQQLQKSKCKICSESKAEISCLRFQRELLECFFKVDKSVKKDTHLTVVTSDLLTVKTIEPDELTVSMLHNLLLTAELDSEEREWVGQLYEQRKQFSSMAITEEKFQEIWRKSEEIVLHILKKYSKGQAQIMEKYIKVIKTMLPQWDMVEDAWQLMEKEFHLQVRYDRLAYSVCQLITISTEQVNLAYDINSFVHLLVHIYFAVV